MGVDVECLLSGNLAVGLQPTAGTHFDEVLAIKLTVDPRPPMTFMEQADRKLKHPLWAYCRRPKAQSNVANGRVLTATVAWFALE